MIGKSLDILIDCFPFFSSNILEKEKIGVALNDFNQESIYLAVSKLISLSSAIVLLTISEKWIDITNNSP